MAKNIALYSAGQSVVDAYNDGPLNAMCGTFDLTVSVNYANVYLPSADWMIAGDDLLYTQQYNKPHRGYVVLGKWIPLVHQVDTRQCVEVIDWSSVTGPCATSFPKALSFICDRFVDRGTHVWVFGCDWTADPVIGGHRHDWGERRERRERKQTYDFIDRIRCKGGIVYRQRTCPLHWSVFDQE